MTKDDKSTDTVLVPPAGVHTPGTSAHGEGQALVEAPADADDVEGAAKAYKAAQEGDFAATGVAGASTANPDGSARTPAEHEKAMKAEKDQPK
jgi:hypothetical protein